MPTLRSLFPRLFLGACLATFAGGCGESGPSFAGAIDSASTRLYAEDAQALMLTTLVSVFGAQDASTPLPFAPQAARTPPDPRAIALNYLSYVGRWRPASATASIPGLTRSDGSPVSPLFSTTACIPTVTGADSLGVPIDTDADGVPDDYKVDFRAACSESGGYLVYTYSGSYRIHDDEAGWGRYTFTTDRLAFKLVDGSNGDNIKDVVSGAETADFSADLATHSFDVTYARIGTFDDEQLSVTFDLVEESSYDPDPGALFGVGLAMPAGAMDLTLDYRSVGQGISEDNVHFVIGTPTLLHHSAGCGAAVDAGVLRGLLNGDGGTGFQLTWTGCGVIVLQMFGTTDGP